MFIGKYLCWSLFLLFFFVVFFIQKRLQHRYFPLNIAEFLRIAIFKEQLWWLLECSVITLKQVQVASASSLRRSFWNIFLSSCSIGRRRFRVERDLSRVAPATLLLSLSVMDNFLKILQEFKKNTVLFSTKSSSK